MHLSTTDFRSHRLRTATTDEERAKWADALAAQGDAGLPKLLEILCVDLDI